MVQQIQSGTAVNQTFRTTASRRRSKGWLGSMAFSVSFAVVVLSLVLGPNGIAQTTNGLITGTVLDPTGAAIPSATITVTDLGTNGVRKAVNHEHGPHVIPPLPPPTSS